MPKLPVLTPKKLIKKLIRLGFIEDHMAGSHMIFYHPKSGRRANVPFHLTDIPKGTLSSILRESGLLVTSFSMSDVFKVPNLLSTRIYLPLPIGVSRACLPQVDLKRQ